MMIPNPSKNQTEVVIEPRLTSPTISADAAASFNKRTVETTQAPAHRLPGEPAAKTSGPSPLLPIKDVEDLHTRWVEVQAGFVDEPRKSVEQADALVAGVMKRLAETFANERSELEAQWSRGDNVSTEDLRMALQHYRAFFDRLLSL
jgi:hypothetical protein